MFERIPGFANFLLWEKKSRDTIDFKKVYVDVAGDVLAGLLLSQIIYWHLPNDKGENKLKVFREENYWLAKSREEWWEEVRMAPREVDKALERLRVAGVIETRVWKFAGSPRTHIRIIPEGFMDAINAVSKGELERDRNKFRRDGQRGKKTAPPISQKCENGGDAKSEKSTSQMCDGDVPEVTSESLTSGTSSTQTSAKTKTKNTQRVAASPPAPAARVCISSSQSEEKVTIPKGCTGNRLLELCARHGFAPVMAELERLHGLTEVAEPSFQRTHALREQGKTMDWLREKQAAGEGAGE